MLANGSGWEFQFPCVFFLTTNKDIFGFYFLGMAWSGFDFEPYVKN
jgi:hypothetical protein